MAIDIEAQRAEQLGEQLAELATRMGQAAGEIMRAAHRVRSLPERAAPDYETYHMHAQLAENELVSLIANAHFANVVRNACEADAARPMLKRRTVGKDVP